MSRFRKKPVVICDLSNVEVEHLLGLGTGLPLVKIRAESDRVVRVGQVSPDEARQIAGHLVEAAARAEYEIDFFTEARKVFGVERELLRLRRENAVWMNGVADAVEPLGFDREAACGPADLLPGLLLLADQVERLRTSNAGMSRHITVLAGRIAEARALIAEAKDDVDSPQSLGRLTAALDALDLEIPPHRGDLS